MCRSIRVLHGFEPPTTMDEIHAAALQYVRKVSGHTKPTHVDQEAFDHAVEEVAHATAHLLGVLHPTKHVRTREGEKEKARERWRKREARMTK